MTPLLKHELWSSIQAENRLRNGFEVNIISTDLHRRASRRRYVFHMQGMIEQNNSIFKILSTSKLLQLPLIVTVQERMLVILL